MRQIPNLDVHITHDCNFQCESCAHFMQHKFRGTHVSLDVMESWYKDWYQRIEPKSIGLLGGEPFLHPNLSEMCHLSRKYFPNSEIEVVTNMTLVHLHPELWKDLIKYDITLSISIHSRDPDYAKVMKPKLKIAKEWKKKGVRITLYDSVKEWNMVYKGDGKDIMPFEDLDPQGSWRCCPTGQICFQLHEGHIWKCAPLAFLPLMKKKYPDISEKWDPYLTYKPLKSDCSDDALDEFFNRGCEVFCSMCPSKPTQIHKQNPLINRIR